MSARRQRVNLSGESNPDRMRCSATAKVTFAAGAEGEGEKQPTFSILAYSGAAVRPEWPYLPAPLVIDLAGVKLPGRVAALLNHYDGNLVGQCDKVEVRGSEILASGRVTGDWSKEGTAAFEVVSHAKRGFEWSASIGGSMPRAKLEEIHPGQTVVVNGRTIAGPVFVAREYVLDEISFVVTGADRKASARVAARAAKETGIMKEFSEWLAERGFNADELDEKQRGSLRALYDAETTRLRAAEDPATNPTKKPKKAKAAAAPAADDGDSVPSEDETSAQFSAIRARRARHSRIDEIALECASAHPALVDTIEERAQAAKDANTTPEVFELQMRAECGAATNTRLGVSRASRGGDAYNPRVLEVALLRGAGFEPSRMALDPAAADKFTDAELQAAHTHFRGGASITRVLAAAVRAHGFGDIDRRSTESFLRAAFARDPEAARFGTNPSSLDMGSVISNVANKVAYARFAEPTYSEWRKFCKSRPTNDYKTIEAYVPNGDLRPKVVPPGGTLDQGTFSDVKYTNKANLQGRLLRIDERDIINDDLNIFGQLVNEFVLAAARGLNIDIATAINGNAGTFFGAGNANYISGADTVLGIGSLESAYSKFRAQKWADKTNVGFQPKVLLVPSSLAVRADQLLKSTDIRTIQASSGGTKEAVLNHNWVPGRIRVVAENIFLNDTTISGYSDTAWYLLADPMESAIIEIAFLFGQETPVFESAQADFNQFGVQMRVKFPYGVSLQEFRAGVKSKGAA